MPRPNTLFKVAYNRALGVVEPGRRLPSEETIGTLVGVSRTTVRAIVAAFVDAGLISGGRGARKVLRAPLAGDYFALEETDGPAELVARTVAGELVGGSAPPDTTINELALARRLDVGTTTLREFLIRFSRSGLIEKRPNGQWRYLGLTDGYVDELVETAAAFEAAAARGLSRKLAALPADDPLAHEVAAVVARLQAVTDADDDAIGAAEASLRAVLFAAAPNRFATDFFDAVALVRRHLPPTAHPGECRARRQAALALVAAIAEGDSTTIETTARARIVAAYRDFRAAVPPASGW